MNRACCREFAVGANYNGLGATMGRILRGAAWLGAFLWCATAIADDVPKELLPALDRLAELQEDQQAKLAAEIKRLSGPVNDGPVEQRYAQRKKNLAKAKELKEVLRAAQARGH